MWTQKKKKKKKQYKQTCLQNRSRVPDVENKPMVTREWAGGRENWEIGINIYTLLYMGSLHASVVKNPLQCRTWGFIP